MAADLCMDECLMGINGCSDTCINTQGSYICECDHGYKLGSDRMNCEPGEHECSIFCFELIPRIPISSTLISNFNHLFRFLGKERSHRSSGTIPQIKLKL